ncbi:hypothetical protein WSM22_00960 [Cytophagales bacterium WSM2-2]|nr:hypothetical protein WSM22_00960 [Cytophagales bacterium WSM2-2]
MRKLALPLLIGFIVLSCATPEERIAKRVDQLFAAEFKADEPGGAVLVMKEGKVLFEKGYGVANVNTKEKITTETLFNTGSISKTFVMNTILTLVEEGKISVDDSLTKYFPNFKNRKISDRVKVHHLLTHTSGLPDLRWNLHDSIFLLTAKDLDNWAPIEKNDSLAFEPGSRFEYSNPAFNGLALIIEKSTGKKWQEVVGERIFKPSQMPTSRITDGPFPERGVAHGYVKNHGVYIEKDYGEEPTFAAAGNGGVWSSVKELANYEAAIQKNVFLKKELIDRSRTVSKYSNWSDSIPAFIGYSWFVGETGDGLKMISHTGTQGGFYADFVSIPEKGILYVVLCNRKFPRSEFRAKIFEIMDVKLQNHTTPK